MKINIFNNVLACVGLLVTANGIYAAVISPDAAAQRMSRYNVVWNTPSKDAAGVMPIGNGDIAAGVYAIENGDLYLLLSKNDAFNYMGDIFKTGRVRVTLDPNPFQAGKPFRQTLNLATGSIRIEADGIDIQFWADMNRPIYHVEVHSPQKIKVTAQPEFWKRIDHCTWNETRKYSRSIVEQISTQDVSLERGGKLLWYYSNGSRSVYPDDLKYYQIEPMAAKIADPYQFNTFGNLLEGDGLSVKEGALTGSGKDFDIHIHALTMQTPEPAKWIAAIEQLASRPVNLANDWKEHIAWWNRFWDRGWIMASDNSLPVADREKFQGELAGGDRREEKDGAALVAQSYNVFRYLMASQSRGRYPVKFNGGLFTQQFHKTNNFMQYTVKCENSTQLPDGTWLLNADERDWGRRFTFQNQRLLYWPLLASGDFDLMKPFFDYYWNLLPTRQAVTKAWFGHDGAYYRENIEPDGAEQDVGGKPTRKFLKADGKPDVGFHNYYFTCGLETTAMMLDYVNFSGDTAFRDNVLVPFARQILLFYDLHYPREADGKLRLEPNQVLESWWISVNSTPDLAGLRFCLAELLTMKAGTADDQTRWQKLRAAVPEIPMREIKSRQAIAPAAKFEMNHNSENGELYAAFPFRCFGVGLGTGELVDWTVQNRIFKGNGCWRQDEIDWACAGNAAEAARGLVNRFRVASKQCRFPMYGRQGPDSCPDFDHFGSGSIALQRMLVQEAGGKIYLLPAWPSAWDVDFKLHLSQGAVITGAVENGKLTAWDIQPSSRKTDIIVCPLQKI